jgi:deoxyhypusine synthase
MISVKDITLKPKMSANEIIKNLYDSGGFTAKKIAIGVDILEKITNDNIPLLVSFPACICATGTRGILIEMVKRKLIDIVITTCGTLDHDLARTWKSYYHGSFLLNDIELHKRGINRLGNIIIPTKNYGNIIEKKMQVILQKMLKEKKEWSSKEIAWKIGQTLDNKSILYWLWKNKIPIYIPGIVDGAVGSQIWLFYQSHKDFMIDVLRDEQELADVMFNKKKIAGLIIGGGISKHHLIWWSQFCGGLDAAVYITSSPEWDGSLSGARPREAISWGKLKEKSNHVTIEGDATLILPLMIASLIERLG